MGTSLHPITSRSKDNQALIKRGSLTCLMFKGMFSLTLRAAQGLLDFLLELMNVPLCAPDYSSVSKCARTVKVGYQLPSKGKITDLIIDSNGLKVFGEGEWEVRKCDTEKHRE